MKPPRLRGVDCAGAVPCGGRFGMARRDGRGGPCRLGACACLALCAVFVLAPSPALAATTTISIVGTSAADFAFDPPSQTLEQGQSAAWHNGSNVAHTSTSDQGFWDSGVLSSNSTSSDVGFEASGTFGYHCSIHPAMHGFVVVPLAVPATGAKGVAFTVQWASGSIDPTLEVDVQVRQPGDRTWRTFRRHQTGAETSASFTPKRRGTYRFRARLKITATGSRSDFSPVARVAVS